MYERVCMEIIKMNDSQLAVCMCSGRCVVDVECSVGMTVVRRVTGIVNCEGRKEWDAGSGDELTGYMAVWRNG